MKLMRPAEILTTNLRPFAILVLFAGTFGTSCQLVAGDEGVDNDPRRFSEKVAPFLQQFCVDCHGGSDPEAKLGLDTYETSSRIQTDFEIWEKILRFIEDRQMPPADAEQPGAEALENVTAAIRAELESFDCTQAPPFRRVTIRRLNRAEYDNTIRDLIGIDFQPAEDFPADDVGYGFDNIGEVLSMPPILFEKYLDAAETIMDRAFSNEEARQRILAVESSEEVDRREAFRQNLTAFVTRAFRRPPSDEEMENLFDLTRDLFRTGNDIEQIQRAVYASVLVSPHFLFRIEDADEDASPDQPLTDWELASRLSYFLWSSMPDEELFRLADEGKLHQTDVLQSQVRRMLADSKSRALVENFAGQWLQLRDVEHFSPDPDQFSSFDDELRVAMRQETEAFFVSMIRENRSVLEFLTADFTYVNERLARHYGLEGVKSDTWQRVDLPKGRRGVLTHASILLITSNPTRTSPVKRGKWVLENILSEPPPPPPYDVPELEDDTELLGSLRERMEQHRSNETCAVCHRTMDAVGFGLENFDVIGAWRDRDGRFEIDSSGVLPDGTAFDGAAELMGVLADRKKEAFCRCLTEKLLTYALGRGLDSADRCTVKGIVERLADHEYRMRALITEIVLSDQFRRHGTTGED